MKAEAVKLSNNNIRDIREFFKLHFTVITYSNK